MVKSPDCEFCMYKKKSQWAISLALLPSLAMLPWKVGQMRVMEEESHL